MCCTVLEMHEAFHSYKVSLTKKSYQWPKYAQQSLLNQHVAYSQTAVSASEDKSFRTIDTNTLLLSLLFLSECSSPDAVTLTSSTYHSCQGYGEYCIIVGWDAGAGAMRFRGRGQASRVPWLYGMVPYGWAEHTNSVAL